MSPPDAERAGLGSRPAHQFIRHDNGCVQGSSVLALVPRIPCDLEAELSVLAELAARLYVLRALDDIDESYFYDERHKQIFRAVRSAAVDALLAEDKQYLDHAIRYAEPLHSGSLASFLDCAARRRELFVLERRRLELLGVT
jgi:hypothetical protein